MGESSAARRQTQQQRQWLVFPKVDMGERDNGPPIRMYGAPDPAEVSQKSSAALGLGQDGVASGGELSEGSIRVREDRYFRQGMMLAEKRDPYAIGFFSFQDYFERNQHTHY